MGTGWQGRAGKGDGDISVELCLFYLKYVCYVQLYLCFIVVGSQLALS